LAAAGRTDFRNQIGMHGATVEFWYEFASPCSYLAAVRRSPDPADDPTGRHKPILNRKRKMMPLSDRCVAAPSVGLQPRGCAWASIRCWVLVLALTACGASEQPAGTAAHPAKWSDYSYAKEGFAVSAPKEPAFSTKTVQTAAGPVEVHFYQAEVGGGILLVAASRLHPNDKRNARQVIAESSQGVVAALNGKLVTERAITLGKYPGTEFEIAGERTHQRNRVYVANRKVYQVIAIAPINRSLPIESDQFHRSFRIIE
jgi:hypothetical protein